MKIFRNCSLVILFTFSSLLSFSQYFASTYKPKNKAEKMALAKVQALPEVKEFMKYAKKSKPAVMIDREPDSTSKYYWIKVGISNFDIFRTTYNFYVNPKTSEIYIWDQWVNSDGKIITLQQWRNWRHRADYSKIYERNSK